MTVVSARLIRAVVPMSVGMLALSACATAAPSGPLEVSAESPLEIVLAVETTAGDPLADMLNLFADKLEAELGDQVEVTRHLGGAVGNETATLEALRAGTLDVVVVGSDISNLDPTFEIMEIPFLFSDRATVGEFLDGEFGTELSESLTESTGLRVLSFGENGFRHVTNNRRPIETPADLAGLKLRVPEVPARVTTFTRLGAVPTPMSINEIYISLDQGVLDGQENPLKVIDGFSFDEKQQYLSLTGHIYSPAYLTMNAELFTALPEDVRAVVQTAADEAAQESRDLGEAADAELITQFEAGGMTVNEIDTAAFRSAAEEIWTELQAGIPGDYAGRVLDAYAAE
ncbi:MULTISPECIES: TRAP transporter substrate-binding protein [Actinoalloteichus]|uniref:Tripartite ATP-independent periplasmic transporter solute receptor, DctP family n=1 Tax=Actinoalloteichus fjordicus TaxID=1612552 RepID=A0AAC9LEE4_9PSEU|nr:MULTISPECIES: TRAP transporter substrate-binding protein [Actinoalloteichus]APU16126.1 tripartite ATP-independent periplasmic transporter solute receptor, DctP family [Actinoalloteichus fjordicus]APU22189.1 tripartite ATP-independent periplasmic transporter solute receptor, DctP family [Actinoalloteichus sp. GBA129-24]